jgi:hypothetical protein
MQIQIVVLCKEQKDRRHIDKQRHALEDLPDTKEYPTLNNNAQRKASGNYRTIKAVVQTLLGRIAGTDRQGSCVQTL